jgi:hypothetical protein
MNPRLIVGRVPAILLTLVTLAVIDLPRTHAQMGMAGSGSRPLGGYGASTITSYYGGGSTDAGPYVGSSHGFIPYRGTMASGLGVQAIPRRSDLSSIGSSLMTDTPIGGASLSGSVAMGGVARGPMSSAGRPGGSRGRGLLLPFGYEGGIGMGGMKSSTGAMTTRRTSPGPGFGYPFRMPASLGRSSGMAMP